MPKTPQQVQEILHQEIQKMCRTAQEHGISFFAVAMLDDHQTKETDITKSINMDGPAWAAMIADVIEDFPFLEEATLVGVELSKVH